MCQLDFEYRAQEKKPEHQMAMVFFLFSVSEGFCSIDSVAVWVRSQKTLRSRNVVGRGALCSQENADSPGVLSRVKCIESTRAAWFKAAESGAEAPVN